MTAFQALGYPLYLMTILGIAYVTGVAAIFQNKSQVVREWAYSGFAIALVGAAVSHIAAGDPISKAVPAIVLFGLLVATYKMDKD